MSAHDTPEVGSGEDEAVRDALDYARNYWQHGQEPRTQQALRILAAREAAWVEKYAAVVGERESTASRWCTEHDEAAAECWSAHTAPAAAREAKCEGLAPFCCNNPYCPVHGDRIDPAELDAARLVGDMAEAEVVELRARAESAEAALATALREKAEALTVCDRDHGHEGNPARVYGHHGSRRTCIRVKATDRWVYDPAWEARNG